VNQWQPNEASLVPMELPNLVLVPNISEKKIADMSNDVTPSPREKLPNELLVVAHATHCEPQPP
jgi:hypothetical protein